VIFVVGVVLIILGGTVPGLSDYNRSLLAGFGTVLVLIGPVVIGERLFGTFFRDGAKAAADLAKHPVEQVRRLGSSIREKLFEPRHGVADLERRASEGDFQALVTLYDMALKPNWIYKDGIRVKTRFPGCGWAKMSVERGGAGKVFVRFSFEEEPFGSICVSADWMPHETYVDFLGRVAQLLQNANCAPDDDTFSKPGLSALFAHALRTAIELHTGADGSQNVDSIAVFIGEKWAVTEDSLVHLTPPVWSVSAPNYEPVPKASAQGGNPDELLSAVAVAKKVQQALRYEHWHAFNKNQIIPLKAAPQFHSSVMTAVVRDHRVVGTGQAGGRVPVPSQLLPLSALRGRHAQNDHAGAGVRCHPAHRPQGAQTAGDRGLTETRPGWGTFVFHAKEA
jgi:hypothetical protein